MKKSVIVVAILVLFLAASILLVASGLIAAIWGNMDVASTLFKLGFSGMAVWIAMGIIVLLVGPLLDML